MRRIPIRLKLVCALLVPLVALVTVTSIEALTLSGEVDDVKDQASLAELSLGPSSLVTAIEHERDAAGVYLIGQEDSFALPVEDSAQARRETDAALDAFRSDLAQRDRAFRDVYEPTLEALGGLDGLRAQVDGVADAQRNLENTAAASESFDGYSEIMDTLFAANRLVTQSIQNTDLRRGAELYELTARQTDAVARLVRDLLIPAVAGEANGLDTSEEIATVSRGLSDVRAYDKQIQLVALDDYAPLADELYDVDHIVRFPQVAEQALDTGRVDVGAVMSTSTGPDPARAGYTAFRSEVSSTLQQQADDVRAAADARRLRYLALGALTVVAALLVTWWVSRSITGPLHSLTRQAQEMAGSRLPAAVRDVLDAPLGDDVIVPSVAPVTVNTRDEVADVVAALNTVQDSALDLAVEQAVLRRNIADSFVNLGRRNQNLLGRQLDFITELESNEADPDTLASLFRLDHLATRMRRNAESLLVLAGIEPPRKWAAPVRLTDVIRAALGEVEDYQRVALRSVEPATIQGSAAADMAHLLAEFVENALTFSPPESDVEIYGTPAADGRYTLTIADAGLGMRPEEIELANRRLAGAESFTVAPSKYLGHYVAANLALRHGVAIRLGSSPGSGITVTIDLPPALLTADEPVPAGVPLDAPPASVPAPSAFPSPVLAGVGAPLDGHGGHGDGLDVWNAAVGAPPVGPLPSPSPAGAPRRVGGTAVPEVRRTAGGLPMRQRTVAPGSQVPGSARARAQDELLVALTRQGSGLVRRVPGAQMPDTAMPNLRRGAGPTPPGGDAGDGGGLHELLSRFSDGLDRARDQSPPPPDPPD